MLYNAVSNETTKLHVKVQWSELRIIEMIKENYSGSDTLIKLTPFQLTHPHFNHLVNGEWVHVEVKMHYR